MITCHVTSIHRLNTGHSKKLMGRLNQGHGRQMCKRSFISYFATCCACMAWHGMAWLTHSSPKSLIMGPHSSPVKAPGLPLLATFWVDTW